jgi:UDP-N-acetylglucosamine 1-carboxyvinyltransferase
MGAKIEGHGTSPQVQGVERPHGRTHQVVVDRIEAGTFCARCGSGGDVVAAPSRVWTTLRMR